MRTTTTATVVLALSAALAGCSQVSTAPDESALHYKAGPVSATEFANCVDPSVRNYDNVFDEHFAYPAGQRSYAFSAKGPDAEPVVVTDVNGVPLSVSGVVTFDLNIDCETLQAFHERIGLKFAAYNDDASETSPGWDQMLSVYLKQPLERAMSDATQGLDWKDLYTEPKVKAAWEADVKKRLPAYVMQTMGAEYFDNFSVTLLKPDLPENLATAITATQEAVQQNIAQTERNVQVQTKLESIRALVEVLGPDAYVVYQAIEDGKISVVPVPQGSSVVVDPSAPGAEQ